jgi:hypothetical protein
MPRALPSAVSFVEGNQIASTLDKSRQTLPPAAALILHLMS